MFHVTPVEPSYLHKFNGVLYVKTFIVLLRNCLNKKTTLYTIFKGNTLV